jgi:hypothetical protein
MKRCPNCYGVIHERAQTCPHCQQKIGLRIDRLVGTIIVLGLVGTCALSYHPQRAEHKLAAVELCQKLNNSDPACAYAGDVTTER